MYKCKGRDGFVFCDVNRRREGRKGEVKAFERGESGRWEGGIYLMVWGREGGTREGGRRGGLWGRKGGRERQRERGKILVF